MRPYFYNRVPWNIVLGVAFFVVPVVALAWFSSPFVLLLPFSVLIYLDARRRAKRAWSLRTRAYFSGSRHHEYWVYEERHGFIDVALILPVAKTEPGRWELYIPKNDAWCAAVPKWARDRREEISARIAEAWKADRIHI